MGHLTGLYLIIIIGFTLSAQTINLSGTVSDNDNRPVAGAVVLLTERKLVDTTDASGAYAITNESSAAGFVFTAPRVERVALVDGCLLINLTKASALKIELFDCKGHALQPALNRLSPVGDYRFDLSKCRLAAQVIVIRVSVDGRASIFRYFPLAKKMRMILSSIVMAPADAGLVKTQAGIDVLRISGKGYKTTEMPISSDSGTVNVALEPSQPFGIFAISMRDQDSIATFIGRVYEGPVSSYEGFKEVMKSGPCRLYKRIIPSCGQSCGLDSLCVDGDSCQRIPLSISVGAVTVNGLKIQGIGASVVSVDFIANWYSPSSPLAFPPASEGDLITVAATGSPSASAFTLTAKCISPLKIVKDTIEFIDGQPAKLKWIPPTQSGNSVIDIMVDLSSEGGTKGKIECECEDNGTFMLPAILLDSLKAMGISGYPRIEIIRRATSAINAAVGAQLIIESLVMKFDLKIPGLISCWINTSCPEGKTCSADQVCR